MCAHMIRYDISKECLSHWGVGGLTHVCVCACATIQQKGRVPLHFAARYGQLEVAQWLVAHGASIDVVDVHGITPLHQAALGGFKDVCAWLLENGADLDAPDSVRWHLLLLRHIPHFCVFVALVSWLRAHTVVCNFLCRFGCPLVSQSGLTARKLARKRRLDGDRWVEVFEFLGHWEEVNAHHREAEERRASLMAAAEDAAAG